jgi:hypothetical protein
MSRRFVIAAEGLSTDQESKVLDFLKKHGAWWHWIDNFWLLSTTIENDDFGTSTIVGFIGDLNENARVLAFEFPEDVDWTARGAANAKGKDMTDWLRETWSRE